ncbi:MAG TPA: TIR domain-containing protein, partial [Candidatus Angelobacter sp.]
MFDYDIFLSFASGDQEKVRPVWQKLSLNGLRVFWSDAALKQSLGDSWSLAIENALERSRHFILMASSLSMSSEWVRREYQAFFNHCYQNGVRRLVPVVMGNYAVSQLPLFLRSLQAIPFNETTADQIVKLLGGTSIDELKKQLVLKEEENQKLVRHLQNAEVQNRQLEQKLKTAENLSTKNEMLSMELKLLKIELDSIRQRKATLAPNLGLSVRRGFHTDVLMPQIGESITEGTVTRWLKKPGQKVQRDEPLFEISTETVDAEIPAPVTGVLV